MRRLEMILSRLAWFVPTLAGLVIIVFLISNVIPTDPVRVLLGENATTAQIEAMRIKLGYDQPLWVQLARHFRLTAFRRIGERARIVTRNLQTGQRTATEADYVVCTIPLPVLKSIRADFSPPVKQAVDAGAAVYAPAVKVAFETPRRWWESKATLELLSR